MSKNSRFEGPVFMLVAAGLGCFLLSFFAMGLAPWTTLKRIVAVKSSESNPYYDEKGELTSVGRGRQIYMHEACWHCHSQFVRPVAGEPFRYGPTSQAWESMFDVPQTFGTRRVGPDLSRIAGKHPDDWHLAHLYNPRAVVPVSVMPGYPWLFEKDAEGKTVPKQGALDLVAYLQYLGKPFENEIRQINYPHLFKVSGYTIATDATLDRGGKLFRENCTGCHGEQANGAGKAHDFLKPAAANLVQRFVSPSEAYSILNRGVLGSAMPSFREMPEQDLWALAHFVASQGDAAKKAELETLKSADKRVLEKGKTLFAAQCAVCHGSAGGGDGAAAAALNPRPKDFTRRVFAKAYLHEVLAKGIPGSAMAPFPGIKPEDADALHAYITSLYNEEL